MKYDITASATGTYEIHEADEFKSEEDAIKYAKQLCESLRNFTEVSGFTVDVASHATIKPIK